MSKSSSASDALPASAAKALTELGANLAIARKRRNESLRARASRMNVSVPTLHRMESGDPSVGVGVYLTALWLMNKHRELPKIASPFDDVSAIDAEIRKAGAKHKKAAEA